MIGLDLHRLSLRNRRLGRRVWLIACLLFAVSWIVPIDGTPAVVFIAFAVFLWLLLLIVGVIGGAWNSPTMPLYFCFLLPVLTNVVFLWAASNGRHRIASQTLRSSLLLSILLNLSVALAPGWHVLVHEYAYWLWVLSFVVLYGAAQFFPIVPAPAFKSPGISTNETSNESVGSDQSTRLGC